jgi:hypothetical protein
MSVSEYFDDLATRMIRIHTSQLDRLFITIFNQLSSKHVVGVGVYLLISFLGVRSY